MDLLILGENTLDEDGSEEDENTKVRILEANYHR